jgi:hypothetical protein
MENQFLIFCMNMSGILDEESNQFFHIEMGTFE